MTHKLDKRLLLSSLESKNVDNDDIKSRNKNLIDKNLLLNILSTENSDNDNVLRKFGVKGNYKVLQKFELPFTYTTEFYDEFFNLINPLLLPKPLQINYNIPLFGLVDYFSAYYTSDNVIMPQSNVFVTNDIGIAGFNYKPIINPWVKGDMIRELTSVAFNDYYAKLTLTSSGTTMAYGTILNSLLDTKYIIEDVQIRIDTNNINVFDNPLMLTKLNMNGKIETDTIPLRAFIAPSNFQTSIVKIPLNVLLDKNLLINFAVPYNVQTVFFIFKLLKIKYNG